MERNQCLKEEGHRNIVLSSKVKVEKEWKPFPRKMVTGQTGLMPSVMVFRLSGKKMRKGRRKEE